jgi:pyruvate formate lyase activating enzyme
MTAAMQKGGCEYMNEQSSAMMIPLITEIQRFCLQDGPGMRTTIFLKGCPLKCPWCHNPETQNPRQELYFYQDKCTGCGKCAEVCPAGATSIIVDSNRIPKATIERSKCASCFNCFQACLSGARVIVGQLIPFDQILREVTSDRPFYENSGGGVTISGGEPLLFPEFTLELAKKIKEEMLHLAIETSCFTKWKKIEPLLNFVDLFIVDIKTLDSKKHKETIGWPLEPILENIEHLIDLNANVRLHLPIIPGFNSSQSDFEAYIEYIDKLAVKLDGVDILPYHCYGEGKYTFLGRNYTLKGQKDLTAEEVLPLAYGLKEAGVSNITIGGLVGTGGGKGRRSVNPVSYEAR